MELEFPDCALCGSQRATLLFPVRDRRGGAEGEFGLVECDECGLRYLRPRPTREAIAACYPKGYVAHAGRPVPRRSWPVQVLRNTWEGYQRRFLRHSYPTYFFEQHTMRFEAEGRRPRVLDIGCGSGQKLAYLKRAGWETVGIDFSETAISHALGLGVDQAVVGNAESLPFETESFDAVMSWHSLEHHHDPRVTMGEIHRVLKPLGYAIIAVPTGDNVGLRIFRSYWGPLEAPRHLYHFTEATLSRLCEQAGLRVVRAFHDFSFYGLFLDQELSWSLENVARAAGLPIRLPTSKTLSILFRLPILPVNELMGRVWRGSNLILHLVKPLPKSGTS